MWIKSPIGLCSSRSLAWLDNHFGFRMGTGVIILNRAHQFQ